MEEGQGNSSQARSVAFQPSSPLAPLVEYTATVTAAVDEFGDALAAPFSWTFTTAGAPGEVPTALWTSADVPAIAGVDDPNPVELGVKFRAAKDGNVFGVRFYKSAANGGTHRGRLWTVGGALLAEATFGDEGLSGWQEARFAEPIEVTAGQLYVASYYAPHGNYSVTPGYFASQHARGPLVAPDSDAASGNGLYRYGTGGGFPTGTYNRGNYWVDVVYATTPDLSAPLAASLSPARGLQAVAPTDELRVRFTMPVEPASVSFTLSADGGGAVGGAASVLPDDPTTARFVPANALGAGTWYTATVTATSQNGTPSDSISWSFQTATPVGASPATLWDTSAVPGTASVGDSNGVELGVKFATDGDAVVTGVRFYKGPLNHGQHIGHLWSADGTLLGSVAFADESDTGWQQADFSTPIAISGGHTYVASYFAPSGGYAATGGGLGSSVDRAPIHALANGSDGGNGVFAYGPGGFPGNSYGASNYWVDVVVVDAIAPTVTVQTPAAGTSDVATTTTVAATLSEPIQPGSATIELRDGLGSLVAAATTYDPASRTLTLTPATALLADTSYTATVSGAVDFSGNALASMSWAFHTALG